MSELESSGLLDKESEQPAPSAGPTQGPTPSTSTPTVTVTSDGSTSPSSGSKQQAEPNAAEANLAAKIVNAVTDDQVEVPMHGEASDVPEQQTADASAAAVATATAAAAATATAASHEPAEQRVLGDLDGASTWREVLMLLILMLPLLIKWCGA